MRAVIMRIESRFIIIYYIAGMGCLMPQTADACRRRIDCGSDRSNRGYTKPIVALPAASNAVNTV